MRQVARDLGVSEATAKHHLAMLERCALIHWLLYRGAHRYYQGTAPPRTLSYHGLVRAGS